jgi:hypothetical protein
MPIRTLRAYIDSEETLQIVCLKSGCPHRQTVTPQALAELGVGLDEDLSRVGRRMRCQQCQGRGAWIGAVLPKEPSKWRSAIGG